MIKAKVKIGLRPQPSATNKVKMWGRCFPPNLTVLLAFSMRLLVAVFFFFFFFLLLCFFSLFSFLCVLVGFFFCMFDARTARSSRSFARISFCLFALVFFFLFLFVFFFFFFSFFLSLSFSLFLLV